MRHSLYTHIISVHKKLAALFRDTVSWGKCNDRAMCLELWEQNDGTKRFSERKARGIKTCTELQPKFFNNPRRIQEVILQIYNI